jgi:hypothetical protein
MSNRFERMWTVGNYEIQEFCLESFPCQHSIKDLRTGKIWLYRADDIFVMLRDDGVSHPHFEYCREIIRKRDHPTPEEMTQQHREEMARMNRDWPQNVERERKQRELDAIVDKTKASSRLEKLKKQNSICK